jgi:pyruvate formate-lyase activating enzyme-like uncharacterized protein
LDYRRRLKDLLQTRTHLQQKARNFRQHYDKTHEQKKAAYDDVMNQHEEIGRLDSEIQLQRIGNLKLS